MSKQKIRTRDELKTICAQLRCEGKKIGFTSGVFDLLHAGHVEYLEKAKRKCDVLIVGLNSDASVRRYKGSTRPIIPEQQRAQVVAALTAVDYVFIFDERRNQKNIAELKPHFYIKAGDYQPSQLTSKETVESYGGEILLIPIETPVSTSQIIEKIQQLDSLAGQGPAEVEEHEGAVHFPRRPAKVSPAVFLDRDGTINEDIEYLHEPEKFSLLPGAGEGLRRLQDMGYRLVIVTNQTGIGLGYFTKEDFYRVNRQMFKALAPYEVKIDKIYFCPHNITEKCTCRKPEIGLIRRAQKDLNLDLSKSYFIGDQTLDIETGRRAGMKTILVQTGKAGKDGQFAVQPDFQVKDLVEAAEVILQEERKPK